MINFKIIGDHSINIKVINLKFVITFTMFHELWWHFSFCFHQYYLLHFKFELLDFIRLYITLLLRMRMGYWDEKTF